MGKVQLKMQNIWFTVKELSKYKFVNTDTQIQVLVNNISQITYSV